MKKRSISLILACILACSLTGCAGITVVKKSEMTEAEEENDIAGMWDGKALTEIKEEAVELMDLLEETKGDLESAKDQYGHFSNGTSGSLNYAVHIQGTVSEVNTEKKAGYLVVTPEGYEGDVKVMVQIGTVFKGTTIRDYISFINVNDYSDQIAYAQLAKDFNTYIGEHVVDYSAASQAEGKQIELYGCFTYDDDTELLITPAEMKIS